MSKAVHTEINQATSDVVWKKKNENQKQYTLLSFTEVESGKQSFWRLQSERKVVTAVWKTRIGCTWDLDGMKLEKSEKEK